MTGIQKLQASKSGLGKAFRSGVQNGARAFDSFSRSMEQIGDIATLRGPRTRAIIDRARSSIEEFQSPPGSEQTSDQAELARLEQPEADLV